MPTEISPDRDLRSKLAQLEALLQSNRVPRAERLLQDRALFLLARRKYCRDPLFGELVDEALGGIGQLPVPKC